MVEYHIARDQTTDEVLGDMDLTGKPALVTSAGGGLGLETCRVPPARSTEYVAMERDLEKARAVVMTSLPASPDRR